LLAVVFAGGVGTVVSRANGIEPARQVRLALLAVVAGLAGYVIYSSGWLAPAIGVRGSPWLAGLIALAFAMAPVTWNIVRPQSTTGGE